MKLHAFQVMVNQHDMGTILHLTKNLLNYNQLLKSFFIVLHAKTSDLQCQVLCYGHLLDKVGTAFL